MVQDFFDDDAQALWNSAAEMLRGDMAPNVWNNYFQHVLVVALDGDELVLLCDDTLTRSLLITRYENSIAQALSLVSGRPMKPRFVLAADVKEIKKKLKSLGQNSPLLNPRYTFDNFVIGASNRFAYAASRAVAEMPLAYNPLFIHGGSGLGKTHLMQAIGNYMRAHNQSVSLIYVTTETFTNELISAIQNRTNDAFRARYRSVDVLLLDDIQFIAGKTSTQEEFFHTFNTLHGAGKQIVISSDRPPKEIPTLEDRLTSRFDWGLVADIQKPDLETRISILKSRADAEGASVPIEVFYYIAEQIDSNIRELEGSLTKIRAYASLSSRPISIELAEETLHKTFEQRTKRIISSETIVSMVCEAFGVRKEDLTSQRRDRAVTLPRQVAMFLIREHASTSLVAIGKLFGGRDHTTVLHACEKIAESMETDMRLLATINDLRKQIAE